MLHSLRALSRKPIYQLRKSALPSSFGVLGSICKLSAVSLNSLQLEQLASERLNAAEAEMALLDIARKSMKRKAAEAFLQSRYQQTSDSSDTSTQDSLKRRQLVSSAHVAACPDSSHACQSSSASSWCNFNISLPHMNWNALASAKIEECDDCTFHHNSTHLPKYELPQGITVYVVSNSAQIPQALKLLKASMQDSLISLDLEWKPDFVRDTSKVALMQLSSATCCVLLRTCKMGFFMPDELLAFFRNPQHIFLGYAWGSADEKKMQNTFGVGKTDLFSNFLDLQSYAEALGYQGAGLTFLIEKVLGCASHKSKRVSMSNWEARHLDHKQLQYAALDAILTGQVFRGLRLWHSAPSNCSTCHQPLGVMPSESRYVCLHNECNRVFTNANSLQSHAKKVRHSISIARCDECGRLSRKQGPLQQLQ